MSMIATFRRLGDRDRTRLQEQPALLADYLDGDAPDGFGPCADLCVDKAWHAIHFVLAGSAWDGEPPLNFIVAGGTEIGDDFGYGPARGLTNAEVRDVAAALEMLPPDSFLRRFNPSALTSAEIYPEIWDRPEEEDDTRGYVAEFYGQLRSFVLGAAADGDALLIWIA